MAYSSSLLVGAVKIPGSLIAGLTEDKKHIDARKGIMY
jgi:hypothetical protein